MLSAADTMKLRYQNGLYTPTLHLGGQFVSSVHLGFKVKTRSGGVCSSQATFLIIFNLLI